MTPSSGANAMPLTQATFERVALEDPEGHWELHRGRLREKPPMSFAHNEIMTELGFLLHDQLSPRDFVVRINSGRLARTDETYFIPDVYVVSRDDAERSARDRSAL